MTKPMPTVDDLRTVLLRMPLEWHRGLRCFEASRTRWCYGDVSHISRWTIHGGEIRRRKAAGSIFFTIVAGELGLLGYTEKREFRFSADYFDQDIVEKLQQFTAAAITITKLWQQFGLLTSDIKSIATKSTHTIRTTTALLRSLRQELACATERPKTDVQTFPSTKCRKSRQKPPRLPRRQ